jgi:hypothetical protein
VSEEAEVTEAIHAAAHPGRTSKADTDGQADAADAPEANGRGDVSATVDDSSGDASADEPAAPTEEAAS